MGLTKSGPLDLPCHQRWCEMFRHALVVVDGITILCETSVHLRDPPKWGACFTQSKMRPICKKKTGKTGECQF